MSNVKEEFLDILRKNVTREGVTELIDYLESAGFFECPASTRFHGNFKGGLAWHSLNVYYNSLDIMKQIFGDQWESFYSLESVTLVSLMHDLCKIDKYIEKMKNVKNPDTGAWEQTMCYDYNPDQLRLGHGPGSVYLLSQFIKLTKEEMQAIHWHMGPFDLSQYNTTYDMSNAFETNTLAFTLHIADMISTYVDENDKFREKYNKIYD